MIPDRSALCVAFVVFVAFVPVTSVDNSSTKLDTFIPRVITHSLKRSPQGSMTSRTREHIAPNSRASLSCHHAREESTLNYGPHRGRRLLDSPISLSCECVTFPIWQRQTSFQRIQILSPSTSCFSWCTKGNPLGRKWLVIPTRRIIMWKRPH